MGVPGQGAELHGRRRMSTDTPTSTSPSAAAKAELGEIRRALDLLSVPGDVIEIRALKIPGRGKPYTAAGYFFDRNKAAQAAALLDLRRPAGIYVVLNEINAALAARSPDQVTNYLDPTTSDNDIIRRHWLPLDFDPPRPANISANEDEHCAAYDAARECWAWLSSQGWPAPIHADSGNGSHLLYGIDLPADEASTALVRKTIEAIAQRFTGPSVTVDRTVFNAARIWKLYGTVARKGHDMPDRPHRMAQLIDVPEPVEVVPIEKLMALAATIAGPALGSNGHGSGPFTSRLDVPRWLTAHGVPFQIKDRPTSDGRTVYVLEVCPINPAHGGGREVCIMQAPDGRLAAKCMHDSCIGYGWQEFKQAIGPPDPDHWDPPLAKASKTGSKATGPPATLTPGTRVLAGDRGNVGEIVADNGGICSVRFVSPEGQTATKDLPKSQLRALDGQPLSGDTPPLPPVMPLREIVTTYPKLRRPVIHRLLRQAETMNLIASPKAGKSWLVDGLALCVATGTPWLDTFDCERGRVLKIDAELHPENLAHRLPMVAETMGIGPDYLDLIDVWPLRGESADLFRLADRLGEIEPGRYALVLLDAWYRFIPPGISENDNAAVMSLYNRIDGYASRLEASWINVHHASKGDQSGKGTTDVGSGAGAQSRAADTHMIIRPHEQDDVAVIQAVVRSFPPLGPIAIRWSFPVWTLDTEADPRALRTPRGRTTQEDKDRHLDADRQTIVDAMHEISRPETKTFIRDAAKFGNPRFGYAWVSLLTDGPIVQCEDQVTKGTGRSYPAFVLSNQDADDEISHRTDDSQPLLSGLQSGHPHA